MNMIIDQANQIKPDYIGDYIDNIFINNDI